MKIDFEVIDEIGIIKLNNPPENYITTPDFIDLDLFNDFIEKNNCKGIIFHGNGRHFSAGADLKSLYKMSNEKILQEKIDLGKKTLNFISNLNIPTISAVNGVCFGGGLEIALSCHIIVASYKALFAFPETNHNLMPGMSGTLSLTNKIGKTRSINMILTGNSMDALSAKDIELVDYLCDSDEVLEFSMNLMRKFTFNKPLKVIKNVIKSINNLKKMTYEEALLEETKLFCELALEEAVRIEESNSVQSDEEQKNFEKKQ